MTNTTPIIINNDTLDFKVIKYSPMREDEVEIVMELVNQSFVKDEFFKKPEKSQRVSLEEVKDAINGMEKNDIFLVGRSFDLILQKEVPICAVRLDWKEIECEAPGTDKKIVKIQGAFHQLSVWPQLEKKGLGLANVRACEYFCKDLFLSKNGFIKENPNVKIVYNYPPKENIPNPENFTETVEKDLLSLLPHELDLCTMHIYVMNIRAELRPWYEKQGYIPVNPNYP